MKYITFEIGIQVEFQLLTLFQETIIDKLADGKPIKPFKRWEGCVNVDGKLMILSLPFGAIRVLSLLIRNGYSPTGLYSIVRTGAGIETRYIVEPLHEKIEEEYDEDEEDEEEEEDEDEDEDEEEEEEEAEPQRPWYKRFLLGR